MFRIIRRTLASGAVGAVFGLTLGTSLPDTHALARGVGATAFMYGSLAYFARLEEREAGAVSEPDADL